MIVIYTMQSASPNIRRVSIMLHETGLPYTVQHVAKGDDGKFPDAYLAISPNATVPAIVDQENGASLFESGAILLYLAEKTKRFLPADLKSRGEVFKWLMFEVANLGPAMGELYHSLILETAEVSEAHLQRYRDKLARYCAILERQLDGREYLCGDYSIADIALYPWCAVLEDFAEICLDDYPRLQRWATTIGQRPAVIQAAAIGA